ncbi:hypothetical protein QQF64_018384 [Cirrhinus molitorella]|uniref:HTH psq-type domain-containing protein n=1 Tax=Cirrhinus molitorella TaxID=172907 RepID=A0ABR3LCK4_9TELE
MPNIRKRKTDRGVPFPVLERASDEIRQGKSVRGVAKTYGICHVTLHRFNKKRSWSCKAWAHKDCTDGRDFYTCHNCDSD